MKKIIYLLLSFTFLILQSCSSGDKSTPIVVIPDLIKPPYTVRYEVKFSSIIVNDTPEISYAYEYPLGTWRIASAPGTTDYVSNFQLTNGWVKEFIVTVDNNPLRIDCSVCYKPTANASYTTKMFVNDRLVKETTWNRVPESASSPCTFYNDIYDVH